MAGRGRRTATAGPSGSTSSTAVAVDAALTATMEKDIKLAERELESTEIQIQRANFIKEHFDKMTNEQLTRFEFFIRSTIPRKKAKVIMNQALNMKDKEVSDEMAIAVCSLTKLFVGEVCDTAAEVMKERGEEADGIKPQHIQEAYRRMQNAGKIGHRSDKFFALNSGNGLFTPSKNSLSSDADLDEFYNRHV